MSGKLKNRWLIACSAVGIHISIGSVYAYSVMKKPINGALHWEESKIAVAFSVAILFLGLSAAFLGFLVDKKGPRFSGRLAAICYGLGTIGTGLAVLTESYVLFIAAYGIVGGIGLGLGYITPVSTLVKWFPDRRGLATGMAIMGFGFSSMIFGPLMAGLFEPLGIPGTLFLLGGVYFVIMFASASYLEPPPENWQPASLKTNKKDGSQPGDISQLTAFKSLRTGRFYLVWILMFINITCGIGLISDASPFAQESIGMTEIQAATMVGFLGLFNGFGRIGWASFSDIIGRPYTYTAFFIIQVIAFFWLTQSPGPVLFQILVFVILTCYGGGFAALPAYLSDMFGTKELSTIHGYVLTAWAAAGLVGPTIISNIKSYETTLYLFTGFFLIALIISMILTLNLRQLRRKKLNIS